MPLRHPSSRSSSKSRRSSRRSSSSSPKDSESTRSLSACCASAASSVLPNRKPSILKTKSSFLGRNHKQRRSSKKLLDLDDRSVSFQESDIVHIIQRVENDLLPSLFYEQMELLKFRNEEIVRKWAVEIKESLKEVRGDKQQQQRRRRVVQDEEDTDTDNESVESDVPQRRRRSTSRSSVPPPSPTKSTKSETTLTTQGSETTEDASIGFLPPIPHLVGEPSSPTMVSEDVGSTFTVERLSI